ncbi:Uncharacterized protein HZ326_15492 [Fusarium oxysporum f. sp. albedinis]|nr:Uncharacterized protein HZ326_15492 [Fusarium oxysporum f. sp. albedinis]
MAWAAYDNPWFSQLIGTFPAQYNKHCFLRGSKDSDPSLLTHHCFLQNVISPLVKHILWSRNHEMRTRVIERIEYATADSITALFGLQCNPRGVSETA